MSGYVTAIVKVQTREGTRVDLPRPVDGAQLPIVLELGQNLSYQTRHTEDSLTVVRVNATAIDELALPDLDDRNVIVGGPEGNEKRQLTEDDILPGFRITQFALAGTGYAAIVRRGDLIASVTSLQYFTATPDSASIVNSYGGSDSGSDTLGGTWAVLAPYTTASMVGSVRRYGTNNGADPTWTATLTAVGATTQVAQVSVRWTRDIYFGMADAAPATSAAVQALEYSVLSPNVERSFGLVGTNKRVVYAYPATYTQPFYRFKSSGFGLAMESTYVAVERNGQSSTYRVDTSYAPADLDGEIIEVFY